MIEEIILYNCFQGYVPFYNQRYNGYYNLCYCTFQRFCTTSHHNNTFIKLNALLSRKNKYATIIDVINIYIKYIIKSLRLVLTRVVKVIEVTEIIEIVEVIEIIEVVEVLKF